MKRMVVADFGQRMAFRCMENIVNSFQNYEPAFAIIRKVSI